MKKCFSCKFFQKDYDSLFSSRLDENNKQLRWICFQVGLHLHESRTQLDQNNKLITKAKLETLKHNLTEQQVLPHRLCACTCSYSCSGTAEFFFFTVSSWLAAEWLMPRSEPSAVCFQETLGTGTLERTGQTAGVMRRTRSSCHADSNVCELVKDKTKLLENLLIALQT